MGASNDALLEQLCRERYGNLVALATMLTGSPADAGDLVHDAVVAVFGRRRKFPSLNAADAYVRRAISTRFIDAKRKAGSRGAAERRFARPEVGPELDAALVDPELVRALQALSPRERACVVLRFVEDLSVAQTAQRLGLAEGSVKRYVSDGLARLNAQLGTNEVLDDTARVDVHVKEGRA